MSRSLLRRSRPLVFESRSLGLITKRLKPWAGISRSRLLAAINAIHRQAMGLVEEGTGSSCWCPQVMLTNQASEHRLPR